MAILKLNNKLIMLSSKFITLDGTPEPATIVVTGTDSIGDICSGWMQGGSYIVTASEDWYLEISNPHTATASQDWGTGNAVVELFGVGYGDGNTQGGNLTFYRSSDNTIIATFDVTYTYYENCS